MKSKHLAQKHNTPRERNQIGKQITSGLHDNSNSDKDNGDDNDDDNVIATLESNSGD